MAKRSDAQGQQELFQGRFWDDYNLLRDRMHVPGKSVGKLLLMTLMGRIGDKRKTWRMSLEELAAGLDYSVSRLRRLIAMLKEACLLVAEPVEGMTGWYEFQVIRSNFEEFLTPPPPVAKSAHPSAPNRQTPVAKSAHPSAPNRQTPVAKSAHHTTYEPKHPNPNHTIFCSEATADADRSEPDPVEPVLMFPVVREKPSEPPTWGLMPSKLAEYCETFDGLDVLAECRAALQWLRDNPSRRKTARGMPRFIGNWLARSQNSGRARRPTDLYAGLREFVAAGRDGQ